MTIEIICCVIGTIAFSITMKAPKKSLAYIVAGSAITAAISSIFTGFYGDFTACLIAMLSLTFYSELSARILKMPSTVILMPSAIPLLPGSAIYYTMFYAIQSDLKLFIFYAKSTLYTGLGIALGAVIGSAIVRIINFYREK